MSEWCMVCGSELRMTNNNLYAIHDKDMCNANLKAKNTALQQQVAELTEQVKAANEDAERLASAGGGFEYTEDSGSIVCRFCGAGGWIEPIVHKPDCSWVLHRARIAGMKDA